MIMRVIKRYRATIKELRAINEEHREINGRLREENKVLRAENERLHTILNAYALHYRTAKAQGEKGGADK